MPNPKTKSRFACYAYGWLTLGLFLFSLAGHWIFAWFAYTEEQRAHNQPIEISNYVTETLRDTLENWQSEFLQLIWQVGGLALFLYVGSPSSKEGDDRKEEKLDAIIRLLDPKDADKLIARLDRQYHKR
jgi:hypothetical protein